MYIYIYLSCSGTRVASTRHSRAATYVLQLMPMHFSWTEKRYWFCGVGGMPMLFGVSEKCTGMFSKSQQNPQGPRVK